MKKYSGLEILTDPAAGNHIVKVCHDAATRAEAVTYYIEKGLSNEEAVIVIARPELRKAVIALMEMQGLNVPLLKEQGKLKFFDAEFLLSNLLVKDEVDLNAFQKFIGVPIQTAKRKYGKVRAFGEMVDVLWKTGRDDTALQLEDLWNQLLQSHQFSLLHTYSVENLDPNNYEESLELICKRHTHHISAQKHDPSDFTIGEAMSDIFGIAWNRVMKKIITQKNSIQMPPVA